MSSIRTISTVTSKVFRTLMLRYGKPTKIVRGLKTSVTSFHMLDPRDKDHEKKEQQITSTQEKFFDKVAKERAAHDKKTYVTALKIYAEKERIHKRGHVEFIYASLKKLKEFGVHRDINVYRHILDLFPKDKMINRTTWQIEFMHYPKQQQCCIDVLDRMEYNGVVPDDEMGFQLIKIFGEDSHAFRKYRRMMYWMPKFKNANPFPIPPELPDCRIEIAKLAIKRMAVDLQNEIDVFQTHDLDNVLDDTFIVNGQSPDQRRLLLDHPMDKPVFVEGGYNVWLKHLGLKYFVLRSEVTPRYTNFHEERKKNKDDEDKQFQFNWDFLKNEGPDSDVAVAPSVHEQAESTILAMCITGTSSKDSLVSWIKFLEKSNPTLEKVPVVFLLETPDAGLQVFDGEKPLNDLEINPT